MNIAACTVWYNEEDFAPFFLRHYLYVDKIFVLVDSATDDFTREILGQYHNVEQREIVFPEEGVDEDQKISEIMNVYEECYDYDWFYNVDADELIFPPDGLHPYSFLRSCNESVIRADLIQVYRHESEKDLDYSLDRAFEQRRHGTRTLMINGADQGHLYHKPIIVRTYGVNPVWCPGNHTLQHVGKVCEKSFLGAHWAMADEDIAIKRRLSRKARQSKNNLAKGYNIHQKDITEESIREECRKNSNLPRVF